jgi:hypothetical protein
MLQTGDLAKASFDNAFLESFCSALKREVIYHHRFATFAIARSAIFNYIEIFYNGNRPHPAFVVASRSLLNSTNN